MRSIKFLFLIVLFSLYSNPIHAVGYRIIEKEGLKVSVWYPSTAQEKEIRYGPFDAYFAIDAIPTEGKQAVRYLKLETTTPEYRVDPELWEGIRDALAERFTDYARQINALDYQTELQIQLEKLGIN